MLNEYEYHADGRIGLVTNQLDGDFSRGYGYDHAGRLSAAGTFGQAFSQTFEYDVWDNRLERRAFTWGKYNFLTSEYQNNRNILETNWGNMTGNPQTATWAYDAAGNVARDHNKDHTYDAAGRKTRVVEVTRPTFNSTETLTMTQSYDGDGRRAKRFEQAVNSAQGPRPAVTTYYVRSTALGGAVMLELDASGGRRTGYVYAQGTAIAKQQGGQVRWVHTDPVTGTTLETLADGRDAGPRQEYDPLGSEVTLYDPYPPEVVPDWETPHGYGGGGNIYDGSGGCLVDGQPMSCSLMLGMVGFGRGRNMNTGGGGSGAGFSVWVDEWEEYAIPGAGGDLGGRVDGGTAVARQVGYYRTVAGGSPLGTQINQRQGPQNTTPFTQKEVDALRDGIMKLLTDKCKKFIENLLKDAASSSKNPVISTNPMDLFEKVVSQKGFVYASLKDGMYKAGYSGVYGSIMGTEDAQVLISSGYNDLKGKGRAGRDAYVNITALGELLHIAGQKSHGGPYGSIGYGDEGLALAAFNVAPTVGLKTPDPRSYVNTDHMAASGFFHGVLARACNGE